MTSVKETAPKDTGGRDPQRRRWTVIGLIATATIVVAVPLLLMRPGADLPPEIADSEPTFVGSGQCQECHEAQLELWTGSDHDKAMDVATDETVLGDFDDATFTYKGVTSRFYRRDDGFFVFTEGPGGEMLEFEVTHVFGHDPLQQYLIPFPGGRLQTLNLTWDVIEKRWYSQYPEQDIPPDDWLHWTRGGQNWNGMCAECHSTNLQKGYDPMTDTYETTFSEIDVSCEACHGAGSRHVAWAEVIPTKRPDILEMGLTVPTSSISPKELVQLCAPCHSRRAELGDYDHTGGELLDHMLPSLIADDVYHPDGQILDEVYVYGSFLQSKMYSRDVSCANCHNSHSLQLHREGNELCLGCHQPELYDTTAHHFHEKIIDGAQSDGAACVKCHMVEKPYMGIDWRADHSLRVPRPDLSLELGTPNACTQSGCHADKPLQWSVDAYNDWYGEDRTPHFGTVFAAARRDDPSAQSELILIAADDSSAPIVRATALELLSRTPRPDGIAQLNSAMSSDDPLIRRTAAAYHPLATLDDVELFAPLLSDSVKAVRLAAVSRLAQVPREHLKPYQQDAFDAALAEYRESMAYVLDFASSAYNLGNMESMLGNPEPAETYYRGALKIDDLFSPAKMNLAILLGGQARNDEAETLLREVLRDYPEHFDAHYLLGLLLVELGRPDDAVDLLLRAVELRPDDARTRYNLGLLQQQTGRIAGARKQLRLAFELEPNVLEYMHAYGDHLFRTGQLENALLIAERMIRLYPDQPIGNQMKAAIMAQQ